MEFSISKGCFLSQPKTKKAKSVLRKVPFHQLPGETVNNAVVRQKAFERCWNLIENKLQGDISDNKQKIYEQFDTFVQNSTHHQTSRMPGNLIPIALIHKGCSCSSEDMLFSELKDDITEHHLELSPATVLLSTTDISGTNIKSLMKAIMLKLVDSDNDKSDPVKLPDCSMGTLCGWYSEHIAESEENKKPICILIDNFEVFPLNVFQDLVAMLSLCIDFGAA